MKKYTINDLVMDIPEAEKERSRPGYKRRRHRTKKKNTKQKYTLIALLTIVILVAGVLLGKMMIESSADTGKVSAIEDPITPAENNTSLKVDNSVADEGGYSLSEQVRLLEKVDDELLISRNDTTNNETIAAEAETNKTIEVEIEDPAVVEEESIEGAREEVQEVPSTVLVAELNSSTQAAIPEVETREMESVESEVKDTPKPEQERVVLDTVKLPKSEKIELSEEKESVNETKKMATTTIEDKPEKKIKTKPKRSGIFSIFAKKPKYYIQVGVFDGVLPRGFISKIKKSRLNYLVTKRNNIFKVKIGPYNSLNSAKKAKVNISRSLGVKGFIIKVK